MAVSARVAAAGGQSVSAGESEEGGRSCRARARAAHVRREGSCRGSAVQGGGGGGPWPERIPDTGDPRRDDACAARVVE
jgi:hypothetical protein